MTPSLRFAWLLALTALFVVSPVRAEAPEPLRLALIVGVNRSVDPKAAVLHYADDDAARYFDLFATLGISAELLTRPDENTQRLHEGAAKAARPPLSRELDASVRSLGARAARARAEGRRVVLYLLYAGHGNVENGVGFITLEDARLTGKDIEARLLGGVRADQAHVIVDACNSYFLVYSRGPGGQRRRIDDFGALLTLGQRSDVGVLLSTSSARESHEWDRVQAGVFSHEVRSGLYGAADADQDGLVSYQEIAAFVARANQSIPNQRFRPEVYAHPPANGGTLLDLREALARRIEIPAAAAGHYELENQNGIYLAEFHSDSTQRVRLVRPRSPGRLYLGRLPDRKELVIEDDHDVVDTSLLALSEPRNLARGAENEAFSRVFELPFGAESVSGYRYPALPRDEATTEASRTPVRRYVGFGLIGVGVVGGVVGSAGLSIALTASNGALVSQEDVVERNERIHRGNLLMGVGFGLGAAAAATGITLLLWPESAVTVSASATPGSIGGELGGRF